MWDFEEVRRLQLVVLSVPFFSVFTGSFHEHVLFCGRLDDGDDIAVDEIF